MFINMIEKLRRLTLSKQVDCASYLYYLLDVFEGPECMIEGDLLTHSMVELPNHQLVMLYSFDDLQSGLEFRDEREEKSHFFNIPTGGGRIPKSRVLH